MQAVAARAEDLSDDGSATSDQQQRLLTALPALGAGPAALDGLARRFSAGTLPALAGSPPDALAKMVMALAAAGATGTPDGEWLSAWVAAARNDLKGFSLLQLSAVTKSLIALTGSQGTTSDGGAMSSREAEALREVGNFVAYLQEFFLYS